MPLFSQDLDHFINDDLALRRSHFLYRARRPLKILSPTKVEIQGEIYTNFASNNYLGFTHHPRMIAAAQASLSRDGIGSGAAALITGYSTQHAQAESAIAHWKGTQDAVLLPSGYQANFAAVQTLAAIGRPPHSVRFLIDKLAHASLIDAVRATSAEFRIFPHNHLAKLQRLLRDAPADQLQVVITESIFSMDGDAADLAALAELKQKRPFILLLDEAHATGVYGPAGAGLAAELNLRATVDISIATLSKAIGSVGAAVCASKSFCDALVNFGRAYIYSTSVPPWIAACAIEAIGIMRDEPHRQARVRHLAQQVRCRAAEIGLQIPPGDSPIIPIIAGEESRAVALSNQLAAARMLVPSVRPPTVAKGASRLRLTLCSDHTDADIERLLAELAHCKN